MVAFPCWNHDGGGGGLQGDLYDHGSLVSAFKQVDVVISTIGTGQVRDQTRIVDAIKEAGNVKVNNHNPLHVDQWNRVHTEALGFRLSLLPYWWFWLRSEALIRIVEWTGTQISPCPI